MVDVILLELSSLPQRHALMGYALLRSYAPCAVVRLQLQKTETPAFHNKRSIAADHQPSGEPQASRSEVVIGLDGDWSALELEQLPITMPERTITEFGAVCVAALMVSHFEQAVIVSVLPIGSGGDYLVEYIKTKRQFQLEVSGLLRDDTPSGADVRARVTVKSTQVGRGLVSVTAFNYRPTDGPYTVLCESVTTDSSTQCRGKRK